MGGFKRFMGSKPVIALVSAVACLCLATVFVAAGLAVCSFQPVTRALSEQTSAFNLSLFSHDDLVDTAVATRDYTVDTHDINALAAQLKKINIDLLQDGRKRIGAPDYQTLLAAQSTDEILAALDGASDLFTLDAEAISHLDDVYNVISVAWKVIAVIAVLCVAACAHLAFYRGRKGLSPALIGAGAILLIAFAFVGIWAAVDFYGFFAFFHSLFFAEGSWVFNYDSLLICMLPTEFWMGMGVIWLLVTCVLSILSLIIGIRIRSAKNPLANE